MFEVLRQRWSQGYRTMAWPEGEAVLPDRYRGRPSFDAGRCPPGCTLCQEACPTQALQREGDGASGRLRLDLGRCLFCPECPGRCPQGRLDFTRDFRLAAARREDLVIDGGAAAVPVAALDDVRRRLYQRSFKLRQVSAGGCNACEADANVLSTLAFDLGRFGIQFVASPRHADALLVTGPVSENMRLALLKTYEALPPPRVVIAGGACAIGGGPFRGLPAVHDGVAGLLPVDLYVPGCPPHPLTLLEGLLRLLGRL